MISSQFSSTSGVSDVSYVSGLSNISAISQMRPAGSTFNSSQNNKSEEAIPSLDELVGSECYISPEMVTNRTYTYASDIWALGIIIFQFFVGKVPFKGKNQDHSFELIKACKFEVPSSVPEDAKDLI